VLRRHRSRSPALCRGGALIVVLWLVSLLTVMALTTLTVTRGEDRALRRVIDASTAEITADSAIKLTLLQLTAEAAPTALGTAAGTFAPGVSVQVERERQRIDVNAASPRMLAACFAEGGSTESEADSLAAKVVDWRDEDDFPELGGAEASDYRAVGLDYVPPNRPLQSVEELRRVLGLQKASDSLLDLFTVYTHEAGPDEISSAFADDTAIVQPKLRCRGLQGQQTGPGARAAKETWIGEVVRVHACATGRARLCRVAVVRLTGNRRSPFQIFAWRTEPR
jgi:type II secretory pathway component PulK